MDLDYVYAPITKREKDANGHLIVSGIVSGPGLDLDEQRMDPTFLKAALPEWLATGGNVREMHQSNAVGKGIELAEQTDGNWLLTAKIVDPGAIAKIEEDVLTGFSVGVKGARVVKDKVAKGGAIVGGKVVETSIVDRPCLPVAKFVLAKSASADTPLTEVGEWADPIEPDETKAVQPAPATTPETTAPESAPPALASSPTLNRAAALAALTTGPADDLTKTAEHDAAQLQTIRQGLVDCIKAELDELAAGEDELWDISRLLCAARDFCGWWNSEAANGEVTEPATTQEEADMDYLALGVNPDIIKAAKAADAPTEARTALRDEVRKALGIDEPQSDPALEDRLKTVEAELEKVLALPTVGGPARTRDQANAVRVSKAAALEQDAARYGRLVSECTDPDLIAGYRQMAKAAAAELAALNAA